MSNNHSLTPIWHRLGRVLNDQTSARQALDLIGGDLTYEVVPATALAQGQTLPVPGLRAIVRHAAPLDPAPRVLGTVGDSYTLISPLEVADVVDSALNTPLDAIGILDLGAKLFLTLSLPALDVRGDEIERYLGIVSPYDGSGALSAEVWPLRVICQNALRLAQSKAVFSYRMRHDPNIKTRLHDWVKDAYSRAQNGGEELQTVFEALADQTLRDEVARAALREIQPNPQPPRPDAPAPVLAQRTKRFEAECARRGVWRDGVFALFAGAGVGMTRPACNGTAFGLYNAVCEAIDHRTPQNGPRDLVGVRSLATDATFGDGAKLKERAFGVCQSLKGAV